jgi:rubrerythrin
MASPTTVDEILDFAIAGEQEAVDFYTDLAGKVKSPAMQVALHQFADEERAHKTKLIGVKGGGKALGSKTAIEDLKLGDYMVEVEPGPDTDYQAALIIAMKKEKAAFRLYSDLAAKTADPGVKEVLLELAQEEAKHKLRFEVEYDEYILVEN